MFIPRGNATQNVPRFILVKLAPCWLGVDQTKPAMLPAAVYSDRRSLLFGLHGLTFDDSSGARSTEGADFAASTDELLGSFHTAQTNAAARRREAAGASLLDDKAQRKHEWAKLGVPASLLVPTLLTCELQLDESTRVEALLACHTYMCHAYDGCAVLPLWSHYYVPGARVRRARGRRVRAEPRACLGLGVGLTLA